LAEGESSLSCLRYNPNLLMSQHCIQLLAYF